MEYVCCTSGRSKIQSAGHSILALHPLPVREAAASLSCAPWLSRHGQDSDAIRPQLIAVLATCNQFSSETIRFSLGEVQVSPRKLLCAALAEAPDSRLMALGAAAAEDSSATGAGSAVRAASRSRSRAMSPGLQAGLKVQSRHHSRSNLGKPPMDPSGPSGPTRRSDSQTRGERSPSFSEVLQPLIVTRLDGGQQKMWASFSR
ncbi:pkbA [Symbiodinium sp. CCMP2592]|nr:pkbA [Symbiodinium sp. CCMP2592]